MITVLQITGQNAQYLLYVLKKYSSIVETLQITLEVTHSVTKSK